MGDCFAPLGPPLLPWDLMAHTDRQTDRTTDMPTPRPTRPSGAELVKIKIIFLQVEDGQNMSDNFFLGRGPPSHTGTVHSRKAYIRKIHWPWTFYTELRYYKFYICGQKFAI